MTTKATTTDHRDGHNAITTGTVKNAHLEMRSQGAEAVLLWRAVRVLMEDRARRRAAFVRTEAERVYPVAVAVDLVRRRVAHRVARGRPLRRRQRREPRARAESQVIKTRERSKRAGIKRRGEMQSREVDGALSSERTELSHARIRRGEGG